jgi:hypothetical protein
VPDPPGPPSPGSSPTNGGILSIQKATCVIPGTKILTESGDVNVENISIGDWVIGVNELGDKSEYQIVDIKISSNEPIYVITHELGVITCSESHCIYSEDSFKNAYSIKVSDTLKHINGNPKVKSIEIQRPKLVIGPRLANGGCYFADGLLVHSQDTHPDYVKTKTQSVSKPESSLKNIKPVESKSPRLYVSDGVKKTIKSLNYNTLTDCVGNKFNLPIPLWKYSSKTQWKKAFYLDDLDFTEETTGYSFNSNDDVLIKLNISMSQNVNNYIVVKGVGSMFELKCTFNSMPIALADIFEFEGDNSQVFFIDINQIESSSDASEFIFEFKSSFESMITNLNIISCDTFESIMNYFQENTL